MKNIKNINIRDKRIVYVKKLYLFFGLGKNKKIINIKFKLNIILLICILFLLNSIFIKSKKFKEIKVALCAVGKKENLYILEFIEYYIKLGIDHFFIYDDNEPNTEKISSIVYPKYKQYVTIYENLTGRNRYQSVIYSDCYKNNNKEFDWLLMIDIDEFLYIKRYKLKEYLTKAIFNKCDFIKFNWIIPTDNNLIHYDNRSLFERFKGPYIKSIFVKTIIRGNISNLIYMVHSPYKSPNKNITCNNLGKVLDNKIIDVSSIYPINIKEALYILNINQQKSILINIKEDIVFGKEKNY